MNPFKRILSALKRSPETPEDIAARQEAERLAYEIETLRVSQRSAAGESYQSGRGFGR